MWPDSIDIIRAIISADTELMIVGGAVRDALLGRTVHDIDLVTPDDGLHVARMLADALHAAYFPLDADRRTGRIQWIRKEETLTIDVSSFRGASLEEDLLARDFTINAMAAPLAEPSSVIDPLDGQHDLFDDKVLRQCNPHSIHGDPIRALRAARMSVQFRLLMIPETSNAVRGSAHLLTDEAGQLLQPERCRDELFKILAGPRVASSIRLLHTLGLLETVAPFQLSESQFRETQATVDKVSQLVSIIEPRTDNTAADLTLGVAAMILDRHRPRLQQHLKQQVSEDRTRRTLLLLASLTPKQIDAGLWSTRLRLSNREHKILRAISTTNPLKLEPAQITDRQVFQFYRTAGESGIEGLLLGLARYLAEADIELDPVEWGQLLEREASPLIDAFYNRHDKVVSPPPLLSGDDLQSELGIQPGPVLGKILFQLVEEQAAGAISTRQEAFQFARNFLDEIG